MIIAPPGTRMTTQKLRMWHWDMALKNRTKARKHIGGPLEKSYTATADFHIKAVQVLNDCPDCIDTTAEQDLEYFKYARQT